MNARSRLKSEFQRLLVYFVVFVIFFMFAIAAVFAMNRVIRYYTERETDVFATNLQLDLDVMLLEAEGGLADPEIRHLLEIYARLHDLDIVVTDRKGIVQVGTVRELTAGEPLFAQRSVCFLDIVIGGVPVDPEDLVRITHLVRSFLKNLKMAQFPVRVSCVSVQTYTIFQNTIYSGVYQYFLRSAKSQKPPCRRKWSW